MSVLQSKSSSARQRITVVLLVGRISQFRESSFGPWCVPVTLSVHSSWFAPCTVTLAWSGPAQQSCGSVWIIAIRIQVYFSVEVFQEKWRKNQFSFRITLMKKTKEQLNSCPRPVHMFSNYSCPMILLSIRITFSLSTLIFVQHRQVQVTAYKSQYLRVILQLLWWGETFQQ